MKELIFSRSLPFGVALLVVATAGCDGNTPVKQDTGADPADVAVTTKADAPAGDAPLTPANDGPISVGSGGATVAGGAGGTGAGGTGGAGTSGGRDGGNSDVPVTTGGNHLLDLLFVIDNSPSMGPKQEKLKAQFPKLIAALRDPTTGALPDLRVAIVDTDLGSGGAYTSGTCGPKTDNGNSPYGDMGKFRMIDAAACGVTDPNALWLEYPSGGPANFTGELSAVFSCLAGGVGTLGCGVEHSIQAVEFALLAKGIGNEAQQAMLRPEATLGLVFLTDEDDCSAATNDGMFGDKPPLRGESASLRCATRAHACGGTNLTADPPAPGFPTTTAFEAPFWTCTARTDACSNALDGDPATDTSVATACSPLRDFKRVADALKLLKADPAKLLVAGIFGWPVGGDMANALPYKIAPVPNPSPGDTVHPTVFEYWPVCYDPDHPPVSGGATGFDLMAAGWGATGGLRMSAFIDEFGSRGLKFSICERDFAAAMTAIAGKVATTPGGARGAGGSGVDVGGRG